MPAPLPPNDSRRRVAVASEPPPHAKVGELWCYDAARADEFIRWRTDTAAVCEEQLADKQLEADVSKLREGNATSGGVSVTVLLIAVGAALALGFGSGAAVALMNK